MANIDDITALIDKYPHRFWAIFLGCMHKPTHMSKVDKRFGFAKRSLYQHNIVKEMVRLGVLKFYPSDNRKFKLYFSQVDWLYSMNGIKSKKLYKVLNEPAVREAFDFDKFNVEPAILKIWSENVFYAIVQIIAACLFWKRTRERDQLIFTMIPHFLRDSHIDTFVMAIMILRSEGK